MPHVQQSICRPISERRPFEGCGANRRPDAASLPGGIDDDQARKQFAAKRAALAKRAAPKKAAAP